MSELKSRDALQWMIKLSDISKRDGSFDGSTVQLFTAFGCMSIEHVDMHGHVHTWPPTNRGVNASISCVEDLIHSGTRKCHLKSGEKYARWLEPHTRMCTTTSRTTSGPKTLIPISTSATSSTSWTSQRQPASSGVTSTESTTISFDSTPPSNPSSIASSTLGTSSSSSTRESYSSTSTPSDISNLEDLTKIVVSLSNILSISSDLLKLITSLKQQVVEEDIWDAILVVQRLVPYINGSREAQGIVMDCLDALMEMPREVLRDSELRYSATTKMLRVIGDIGEAIAIKNPRIFNRQNFALGATKEKVKTLDKLSMQMKGNHSKIGMEMSIGDARSDNNEHLLSEIVLPKSLYSVLPKSFSSEYEVIIVCVAYKKDNLFTVRRNGSSNDVIINSHVMSAEVRGHPITNLNDDPVLMTFQANNVSLLDHHKQCVYWDFNTNMWSSEGCNIRSTVNNTVFCSCTHFTNFAVLFSTVPPVGVHADILTHITYAGLAISILGAFVTLLTYSIFPMLRRKIPPKVLMNLCVAIILLDVFFLLGNKQTLEPTGCKVVSFGTQYFFLSVFTWSAVEAFQSCKAVVKPLKEEIKGFVQKSLIFGWGVPLLLSGIGVGISLDDHNGQHWCVVGGTAFIATVLIPVTLLLLFNIICLFAISFTLIFKTSSAANSKPMDNKVRLRIIFGFIILFGITWVIGFFVISNDVIAFQYIFCILSCCNGLYVFLFYGIRVKKNRWAWGQLMKCHTVKEIQRLHTKKSQMGRCNAYDASLPMTLTSTDSNSLIKMTKPRGNCNTHHEDELDRIGYDNGNSFD